MQKPFNRRQLIKFLLKIGLSFFSLSLEAKNIIRQKILSKPRKIIKEITALPEIGPWPTIDPFYFAYIIMTNIQKQLINLLQTHLLNEKLR